MTAKKKRNSKKGKASRIANKGVENDSATTPDTPAWQSIGKPNQKRGGFQSQPRSVGKRYWRM